MAAQQPSDAALYVGERVQHSDGAVGTVRYVGPVEGSKNPEADFVGVEWDDPERGNCDGEKLGRRYFETAAPTGASFVKPRTLAPRATLAEALQRKYGPEEEEDDDDEEEDSCLVLGGGGRPLETLRSVVLQQSLVSGVGQVAALGLRRLTDLDLSGNLLHSWAQVEQVLSTLATLRLLNASGNRLAAGSSASDEQGGPLSRSLQALIVNRTGAQWPDAVGVARRLPALRELGLDGNELRDVDAALPGVHTLRLQDNAIADWAEVAKLGAMAELHTLVLSGNPLAEAVAADGFPQLRSLYAARTALADWGSLDALAALPALRDVRLSEIPLLEGLDERTARLLVIARLPNVSAGGRGRQTIGAETAGLLNRSAIDEHERRDAEKLLVWFHTEGPGARARDDDARFHALRERLEAREARAVGAAPLRFAGECLRSLDCPCPPCRASRRDYEAMGYAAEADSVLYDHLARDR